MAEAGLSQARAQYFPSLGVSGGYNWSNPKLDLVDGNTSWSTRLSLSYPIFNGLQREAGVARAHAQVTVAEAQAAEARRMVLAELERLVAELELAALELEILQESVAVAEEDYRVLRERYQLGAATILELVSSQIGLLEEKGSQGWDNPDERLYIPLSTAQFRVFGTERLRSINVQAISAEGMDAAIAEIDRVLRREHRLAPGEPSDFNVRNQATLMETFEETTQTFAFLLAGIALISLLVGGLGKMNIMLVSVTERTREIGVRKALGARRRHILLQFLIESLVLCIAGGAVGVAAGWGGARLLQRLAGWETVVAPEAVALAFLFSAFVGVFFGLWPARRAARLDPIESLRYE